MRFWLAALASYSVKAFGMASDRLFDQHQLDIEQFVLNGLLHRTDNGGRFLPGPCSRARKIFNARKVYGWQSKTNHFWRHKLRDGLLPDVLSAPGKRGIGFAVQARHLPTQMRVTPADSQNQPEAA